MSEQRKSDPNMHRIKIGRGPGHHGPQLKITGHWLVDYCFVPGRYVTILAVPGRLVILHEDHVPITNALKETMALLRIEGGLPQAPLLQQE
ncbi:SymE family type I addiction module toxin [Edaphocola flava]|uniref:hypothetical protein n=1 Tax=Edaphocola flava TaxID=2499629 RepID=UPI00100A4DA0|nr:hypothetical protein [Edaphocola flava]